MCLKNNHVLFGYMPCPFTGIAPIRDNNDKDTMYDNKNTEKETCLKANFDYLFIANVK